LIDLALQTTAIINLETAVWAELCVMLAGVGVAAYGWRTILSTLAANSTRTGTKKGQKEIFQLSPV
jgi:hypothetical protein